MNKIFIVLFAMFVGESMFPTHLTVGVSIQGKGRNSKASVSMGTAKRALTESWLDFMLGTTIARESATPIFSRNLAVNYPRKTLNVCNPYTVDWWPFYYRLRLNCLGFYFPVHLTLARYILAALAFHPCKSCVRGHIIEGIYCKE